MAKPQHGRFMADLAGHDEVVVFLIGIRPNSLWKVRSWWPVASAMPRMLRHLDAHPEMGLLGAQGCLAPWPTFIQYWRSFDDLERFSRDPSAPHLEPWRSFNRMARISDDVGIWHETYRGTAERPGDDLLEHAGHRSRQGRGQRAGGARTRLGCRTNGPAGRPASAGNPELNP